MKRTQLLTAMLCSAGTMLLILDSKTALSGAREGISLCIRSVVPSLLPFFVLSIWFTGTLESRSAPVLRPLAKLCGIPEGTEGILLSGFLGGYPVGAQAVGQSYRSGLLDKASASRMLSFCSNAGPAFLFGIAGPLFPGAAAPWLLWGIHIFSAVLVAQLHYREPELPASLVLQTPISLPAAMNTAVRVMAAVCGWVIFFRVILAFLDRWVLWLLPETFSVLAAGVLELTNGCASLAAVPDARVRFVLCSGMLAWGGLCVMMQTQSVIEGLSILTYLRGKALQTLFSLILSSAAMAGIGIPVLGLMCLLAGFLRKKQKRDSISPAACV